MQFKLLCFFLCCFDIRLMTNFFNILHHFHFYFWVALPNTVSCFWNIWSNVAIWVKNFCSIKSFGSFLLNFLLSFETLKLIWILFVILENPPFHWDFQLIMSLCLLKLFHNASSVRHCIIFVLFSGICISSCLLQCACGFFFYFIFSRNEFSKLVSNSTRWKISFLLLFCGFILFLLFLFCNF